MSEGSVFPDYLEVATAVVVASGLGKNVSPYIDLVLRFFHVPVLQEYWVLKESRILLKLKFLHIP